MNFNNNAMEMTNTPKNNSFGNKSIYVTDTFKIILQLIQDTKERYSRQFLIELLIGNETIIRKPEYQKLPGYGSLSIEQRNLESFFRLLVKRGYLTVKDKYFGVLKLTDLGKTFLQCPAEEYITDRELYAPKLYNYFDALIEVRRKLAQEANCKTFEICTEYVIEQLAIAKPDDRKSLSEVQSIRIDMGLSHWDAFIEEIQKLKQSYTDSQKNELDNFENLDKLKELIKAGESVESIAKKLNISVFQVKKRIDQLHYCKEMNIRSWLEKQVSLDLLQRVSFFFKTSKEKSLKFAKELLELDYEVIKYGKMYACLT
ncbi:MAG: HRDC domain-containing protein [Bacteroidia bacterium]|nr:HRDC domain-containing protein [Bacteroidia bacterium]